MKRILNVIGAFIAVLAFGASPAFAAGDFTASNLCWNGSNHLTFDLSSPSYTPSALGGINDVGLKPSSNGWDASSYTYGNNGSWTDLPNTTTHFSVDQVQRNTFPSDSTPIDIVVSYGVDGIRLSQDFTYAQLTACSSPTPTGSAMLGTTIDPTAQSRVNNAIGSIPATGISEVTHILPIVMPYVLLVVTLGIAFFLIRMFMRYRDNHDLSDDNVMAHAGKGEHYNGDTEEWSSEAPEFHE